MPWVHEMLHFHEEHSIPNDCEDHAGGTKQCPIGSLRVNILRCTFAYWCLAHWRLLRYDGNYDACQQKPDPKPDLRAGSAMGVGTTPGRQSVAESVPRVAAAKIGECQNDTYSELR